MAVARHVEYCATSNLTGHGVHEDAFVGHEQAGRSVARG